jgi:flagellar basal-body rod protein FlgB
MQMSSVLAGTTQPLLEQVAAFAERRHDVLAGNLANISTPDYKARDLPIKEFQQALKAAVQSQRPDPLNSTSINGAASPSGEAGWLGRDLRETSAYRELLAEGNREAQPRAALSPMYQDGAVRSIEQEVLEMTKNAMTQQFALEVMTAQFNRLQMVISERV